jgi:hypothetical protein
MLEAEARSVAELATFRPRATAWTFWEAKPPGYRLTTELMCAT